VDGNFGYIAAAYGLVWGGLGLYLLQRWRRLGALARTARRTEGADA
jgi:hypothetical protein